MKKRKDETANPVRAAERPGQRLRLFCAVELPQEVRAQAARHMAGLREAAPTVRASWDREEKLHLTLKFFGDVEEDRVAQLAGALERSASSVHHFELAIRGTGAFPTRGLPRVLWLGVLDPSGRLAELHRQTEDECARSGFARERKPFHPHLTIARLRSPEGARRLANLHQSMEFEAPAFPVTEIVLIRSELGPHGSRYTALSHHGLKEAG
jgi:RNA 2',3'-cyclic 3'-phosphodiesterase